MFHQEGLPTSRFRHIETTHNLWLMLLAALLGLAVGIGIYLFDTGIETFHLIFVEGLAHDLVGRWLESLGVSHELAPALALIPILALAGALVGLIMTRFVGHEKHHGVSGIIESVALAGGRLPYWKVPFKALASALSLGAGASVGPEDPSVQIGANLGSFFGQKLHLSEDNLRLLVAAGAASAIAAAFNAPIAGVFFALEVILREFTRGAFGIVVLAAVISSGFTQVIALPGPRLGPLEFAQGTPLQLPFYVVLGLLLAPLSVLFIRVFYWQKDLWHARIKLPTVTKTTLAGALVGVVALWFPQIMGPGREFMTEVLRGESGLSLWFLLALGVVKLFMTSISIGAGFVGGMFAPSLFVGIMFGSFYGSALSDILPEGVITEPLSFAIAGMAGVMAGVVRAPITAILIVFELTNEYFLILPMMLTTVICVYFAERIGTAGIYTLALLRHGIHLQQGRDIDLMQGVLIEEAMQTPAPTIAASASLPELRHKLRQLHTRALCVVDQAGDLVGIVTLGDLQNRYEQAAAQASTTGSMPDMSALTVGDICTRNVVTITPNEVLWKAIRTMSDHDVGRLPVVKPGTKQVVGVIGRSEIVYAYNLAVTRKLKEQHLAEQIRLNTLTGAHVLEMRVKKESQVCGRHIREISWPPEVVVASIQRRGKLLIPQGSTELKADDVLTIVADPHAERILTRLFGGT